MSLGKLAINAGALALLGMSWQAAAVPLDELEFADANISDYELAQGAAATMPGNVFMPQVATDFGNDGFANFTIPSDLISDPDFSGAAVEWVTAVTGGYIVSGLLQSEQLINEQLVVSNSRHFIAKIDYQGNLIMNFGDSGFVLREHSNNTVRSEIVELSDGSLIWLWNGVVQKLDAAGQLDNSFTNTQWAQASDWSLQQTSNGVFMPFNSSMPQKWGSLRVETGDKLRVLGCRSADALSSVDCDLSWFMLNADGSADTSLNQEAIVDIQVDLAASSYDAAVDRNIREADVHIQPLASGGFLMAILASEWLPSGVYDGFKMRYSVYKLDANGVLDPSAQVLTVNAGAQGSGNNFAFLNDVIELETAQGKAIYIVDHYEDDATGINAERLIKYDSNLTIDTAFADQGVLNLTQEEELGYVSFATDDSLTTFEPAADGNLWMRGYDQLSGDLITEVLLPALPAGNTSLWFPTQNRALAHNGEFIYGGASSNYDFVIALLGTDDINGNGIADINERAVIDPDTDGDGVVDINDAFPNDPTEWLDTDGDLIGNNADLDDDNDGISDLVENTYAFLNFLDPSDALADFDGDGFSNLYELEQGSAPDNIADVPAIVRAIKSDFNADGIADIFWRNSVDGSAEIAIGASDGAITRTESLATKSADWNAQLGDFNGDGAVDTLWRNSMSGAAKVAISDASGIQGMVNNLDAKGSVWLSQIGDFNGDGRDDILWRKPSEGFVRVGISNADGDQQRIEYFFNKGEAWAAFVGDFNGDGRDDMLWRRGTDGASKIILTDANGAQANVVNVLAFPRFSAWQVQIGDLNNDGRDDILWRKSSDGTVKVGISGADGKQASSVNHFAKFMAWTATLGDFNGDGGADILWRKPADGTVKIAITGAAGEQASVVGLPARFSAWTQQLADYNGNGRTDILWHKPVTGEVMLGISSPMGYQQSEVSMGNKSSGWTAVH